MAAEQNKTENKKNADIPRERSLKEVLGYFNEVTGNLKIFIIILMILQSISSAVGVLYAFVTRDFINAVTDGNFRRFLSMIAVFGILFVLQLLLLVVNRVLSTYTSNTLENRFRKRLISTIMDRDYGRVSAIHTEEWMTRIMGDASALSSNALQWLPGLVSTVVRLVSVVAAIAVMQPIFLILVFPCAILYILVPYLLRKYRQRMQRESREKMSRLRIFIHDVLSILIMVRSYSIEKDVEDEAQERMNDIRHMYIRHNLYTTVYNIVFSAVTRSGYILILLFCGWRMYTGAMNFGTFTGTLQLAGQLRRPLSNLGGFVSRYYSLMVNIERIMEAEEMPDSDEETPLPLSEINKLYSEKFEGLGFKDINFSYPPPVRNREAQMPIVLEGLSVDIEKGDYVALVGQSGCGKSTFLKLLMCLYPLDSGERYVTLRGGGETGNASDVSRDVFSEPLTSKWRRLFAYVPQGDTFMSGTVREIIAFSDKEAMNDDERLNNAIKAACADDFVYKMEKGVDTELGEKGLGLSEGQLQRLSIARAVFSERPILLLDECTSALDDDTEKRLLCNLQSMTDKTVFIVTHRPAALDICNKIIKFSPEGNVVVEDRKASDDQKTSPVEDLN